MYDVSVSYYVDLMKMLNGLTCAYLLVLSHDAFTSYNVRLMEVLNGVTCT